MQRVNTSERIEAARARIAELFQQYPEWFCTLDGGTSEAISRNEMDIEMINRRLILNIWTPKGNRAWKVYAWDWANQKLSLQASRRMGAERPLLELVPRSPATEIALTIRNAREARCELLANLACSIEPGMRLERWSLSPGARRGQPGLYARILLRQRNRRIAVTGSVASRLASDVDTFLAAAMLWFKRTNERIRPPFVDRLWLIVNDVLTKPTIHRLTLLRRAVLEQIELYQVDDQLAQLTRIDVPTRDDLWKRRLARFPPTRPAELTDITRRLVALAPWAIDVVHARHGQTLRYFGLPFARVRRVMNEERVWFGVEGSRRRILNRETEAAFVTLLTDLMEHRTETALDHHHAFYRNAAEAWLESILRRDITQLDPGLIIAPLHAQFRIARGGGPGVRPIDLLALRQDGRLAVIELKVTEAREHVFQGADYWQRVESHRRRGHIFRARLFGDRKISNEPPLVYLVAPTLRVHPAFNTLAQLIAPDIEVFRFDINDDWRFGVRVMRRLRVN